MLFRSSDSGNYTCVAENSAGKDEYTVSVKVQGKLPALHLSHSMLFYLDILCFNVDTFYRLRV